MNTQQSHNSVWVILIGILLIISGCTPKPISSESPRQRINFDDDWRFHLGHAADPTQDFNYGTDLLFAKTGKATTSAISPKFDDSSWRKIDLPHDWAVELPFQNIDDFNVMVHGYKTIGGHYPESSIGWYRKKFTIPATDSLYQYALTFDGVFRDAQFWLNGFYLGNNKSGYIGVTYNITDYLHYDEENVLVVRVDATQYEGWFYEGAGIYRHVWLNRFNNLHLSDQDLFVRPEIKHRSAKIHIYESVVDLGEGKEVYQIDNQVFDREGNRVTGHQTKLIQPVKDNLVRYYYTLRIKDPHLWDLDDPYLYRMVTTLISHDQVLDRIVTPFGIRTIEVDADSGLLLNGKQVKIKGVNCHQDHAGVGSALPDYLQYYRIGLLKKLGVNAYRSSHNPPTPELLDACDSLGMLVLDETRLLNSSPEYMDQFERMVFRDRNHPSIFMWSIGNEEQIVQTTLQGKRIAESLIDRLSQMDPTRSCTYAADLGNVYKGINEVIPVRGFNYRVKGIEPYHTDHPNQPIVGTEMGSTVTSRGMYELDSINGYVPDQDITAPWWANRAEEWWPLAAENDWMMGGFVWSGFDYRGEPTPFKWPNINSHFGIMDMCGFPKNLYYYYQSWWREDDVLHISPHWNWPGKEGQAINVWVNSNADEVELILNGTSLGKKPMPRNSHLNWMVPYDPGILEAVATKAGRTFRSKVETTGSPVGIVLDVDKSELRADGKDATVINISVIDQEGREVPDAQNLIQFSLEGDARIIGVGNGDPSSHEPDKCIEGAWQRHLFNGKCQVIIQAGKTPGTLKFRTESQGLKAEVKIIRNRN